jgi:hypothetical protein
MFSITKRISSSGVRERPENRPTLRDEQHLAGVGAESGVDKR